LSDIIRRPTHLAARAVEALWVVALLLGLWELVGRRSHTVFFPPFSKVCSQFADDWLTNRPSTLFLTDNFWDTVPITLSRFARGWAIAVVAGIGIGVVLGRSPIVRVMYSPIIRFFMSLPNAALLPIALQFFGLGGGMNLFLIAFGTVWLIATNTADGVGDVNDEWMRTARSLRLPHRTLYARVILPAASPHIFAGLRVSVGFALILMVVGEYYATTAGLGHAVSRFQQTFRYTEMWSAFLLIALIGIVVNMAFDAIERRALRWQRRAGLAEL